MRFIPLLMILSISACSVGNMTDRKSGSGFDGMGNATENTTLTPNAANSGERDYRAELFKEIGQ